MNKIRIIDLLNKIANGEEVPKKIKYDTKNYYFRNYDYKEYYIDEDYIDEQTSFIDRIDFYKLNDDIEIIEEPKYELEEIELIDIHYINGKCIFRVDGKQIDETIAIKVNELIENQNKIIRELKVNNNQ